MRHSYLLVALPLAALISTTVSAQTRTSNVRDNDFSWSFAQLGVSSENREGGFDRDNLYGRLSWALDEHFFARGALNLYDGDFRTGTGPNRSRRGYYGWGMDVGLGFNTPLQQDLDLVLTGDVLFDRYKIAGDYDREFGMEVAGGVRHRATQQIQLSGGAYIQRMYSNNDIGLYGEILLKANAQLDVGADLRLGDDITAVGLFGRFNF
jgi:opacity protein-like surface antigen